MILIGGGCPGPHSFLPPSPAMSLRPPLQSLKNNSEVSSFLVISQVLFIYKDKLLHVPLSPFHMSSLARSRDGVSESQFNQVLNKELDQIIEVCCQLPSQNLF